MSTEFDYTELEKEIDDHVNDLKRQKNHLTESPAPGSRHHFLDVVGAATAAQRELDYLEAARQSLVDLREEVARSINLMDVRVGALQASLRVYNK